MRRTGRASQEVQASSSFGQIHAAVVATTLTIHGHVAGIAADAANVYFTDGAELVRTPRRADGATILESHATMTALAVDEGSVYWATCEEHYRGLIVRTPK